MRLAVFFAGVLLVCGALFGTPQISRASGSIPGGANQMNAVPGRMNAWAFNGEVRVKITRIVDPRLRSYDPYDPAPGNHYLVVRGILSNGTNAMLRTGGFRAWLADAEGITIEVRSIWNYPGAPAPAVMLDGQANLPPGGAARVQFPFDVPVDFQPVTLLLVPQGSDAHRRAFRIRLTTVASSTPATVTAANGNAAGHSAGKPCYVNSGAYASVAPCFGPAGTQLVIRLLRPIPIPPAKLRFDRVVVNGVAGVVVAPRKGAMSGSGDTYVLPAPVQLCMGPGFPKKWFVTLIGANGAQQGRIGEFTITGCP